MSSGCTTTSTSFSMRPRALASPAGRPRGTLDHQHIDRCRLKRAQSSGRFTDGQLAAGPVRTLYTLDTGEHRTVGSQSWQAFCRHADETHLARRQMIEVGRPFEVAPCNGGGVSIFEHGRAQQPVNLGFWPSGPKDRAKPSIGHQEAGPVFPFSAISFFRSIALRTAARYPRLRSASRALERLPGRIRRIARISSTMEWL